MAAKEGKDGKISIIIRKEEVVEGGHHGGAWKVAYADFVTAMMAFFLLMWLLNATTEQQRRGIADYFNPNPASASTASGAGMIFSGRTPNVDGSYASDKGAVQLVQQAPPVMTLEDDGDETPNSPQQMRDRTVDQGGVESQGAKGAALGRQVGVAPPRAPGDQVQPGDKPYAPTRAERPAPTDQELQAELDRRERASFERAAQQIRDAVRADPALADLAKQLMIDITPEGLRVQLVDEDKLPMFASGSTVMNERARALLAKVAPVLMRLPQSLSITGHTDSAPYKGGDRSNWDLSADRANATRRILVEAGLPENRVRSVAGLADRDPLLPDGMAAANRRIAITVLHDPHPAAAR